MKKYALFAAVAFAVVLVLCLHFGVKPPPAATETDGIVGKDGNPVAAVCISDLAELNVLSRVNRTPDEYLVPQNEVRGIPIGTKTKEAAERGTYQFVLLNLDPYDAQFEEKALALEPYLQGDKRWHFTLYLPKVFSACNVYVRTVPTERVGELADYEFIEYSEYTDETTFHKTETEPLFIDLSFYSERRGIIGDRLRAATIVTVHYESESGLAAGLDGVPLIGSDSAVRFVVNRDKSLLTASIIVAALILAVFVFLCFLKKSLSFLPQLLIPLGVFFALLSGFALAGATKTPYFWTAVGRFAASFIAFAAVFAVRVKIKKAPVWALPAAIAAANCVLAFVSPFAAFGSSRAFLAYLCVSNAAIGTLAVAFGFYSAAKSENAFPSFNPVLAGIASVCVCVLPSPVLVAASPLFRLYFVVIVAAVAVSFREFVGAERENRYLTANLQSEVARQTVALSNTIGERDKVLMFVSHDMKKPVLSLGAMLGEINEKAEGELKTKSDAALKKFGEIRGNFDELSKFSKVNFIAEESTAFIADEVLSDICEYLKPDCEANGVNLSVLPSSVKAYGKRRSFSGVVYNLVMNALEHAECSAITLSARKASKNLCRIDVTDDGKGVEDGKKAFEPFVTDNADESNVGLGLYLCRTTMTAMGGSLTLARENGKTIFTATLPLA